ncbi:transcription factor BIM2 isoform X4 [Sorghum bicolor]|uniref:BHLH domain-containing protein n=1 Tax=Sorghum bicolor TaxID=4558 RepID=A0A1B6QD41_SORBI|nr:transcription factor BIM2 isoform X4 [Sorghum bicolor]KXG35839.1 hypothetical protein SORBI_3002G236200 [Sorghum bicolor]|eukprot:XP_021308860.1 transcription factor BIM2 isoform X4 [Sorghum bicolor]
MGIQGNKAGTHEHDFLSLYAAAAAAKDAPLLLHHDSKAPPPPASQGNFLLKTHDFLQPLDQKPGAPPEPSPLPASAAAESRHRQQQQQQVVHALPLPGGVGTFSISPAPVSVALPAPAVVKSEPPFVLWGQPAATLQPGARDLTVRVDRKGGSCSDGGTDQRPNTPRSKHSATEQRRRSKINDRFQILRELLPHNDQKRDKATFLLEVIEYIRFLQEKVQKYEATFPEWNQENAKMLPWSNMYFRSFWKNAQSKGQIPGDSPPDPSHFMRNGSSPGSNFTGKIDDNHNIVTSAAASGAQDQAETDHMASGCYRSAETPANITNNAISQSQPQWTGPSPVDDSAVNSEMLNNQQLAIDEGTISVSSNYSQELLNSLTHALQSSGVDLSQASISVQINLGKRAVKRPVAPSNSKEPADPASSNELGHQLMMLGAGADNLSHTTKRHKPGNS